MTSPESVFPVVQSRANAYDSIAEGYTAENESSLLNEYYNRPAIVELAGDVSGRQILDAGCGSGPIFADLRDRGATMVGFDPSSGMLEQARLRLGDDAELHLADMDATLPFADASFDDVVSSLALHYLEDWGPVFGEFRRILRPGGRLIVSVEHPFAIHLSAALDGDRTDYFQTRQRTEEWIMGGQTAQMTFWDRPLHAMTDSFADAGFRIEVISEPAPRPDAYEHFPEVFAGHAPGARFLGFLFFVLQRD